MEERRRVETSQMMDFGDEIKASAAISYLCKLYARIPEILRQPTIVLYDGGLRRDFTASVAFV